MQATVATSPETVLSANSFLVASNHLAQNAGQVAPPSLPTEQLIGILFQRIQELENAGVEARNNLQLQILGTREELEGTLIELEKQEKETLALQVKYNDAIQRVQILTSQVALYQKQVDQLSQRAKTLSQQIHDSNAQIAQMQQQNTAQQRTALKEKTQLKKCLQEKQAKVKQAQEEGKAQELSRLQSELSHCIKEKESLSESCARNAAVGMGAGGVIAGPVGVVFGALASAADGILRKAPRMEELEREIAALQTQIEELSGPK